MKYDHKQNNFHRMAPLNTLTKNSVLVNDSRNDPIATFILHNQNLFCFDQ